MAKNIIKEIIIILLLALAIILILGVLLYRYTAYNKVLPEAVSYTTPENIKEELASSTNIEDQQPILTYEVTASDLKTYEKTKEYVQGRRNPFAATEDTTSQNATSGNTPSGSQTTGNTNTSSSSSSGNTNTNTNTNATTDSSTTTTNDDNGNFFPDKGTK